MGIPQLKKSANTKSSLILLFYYTAIILAGLLNSPLLAATESSIQIVDTIYVSRGADLNNIIGNAASNQTIILNAGIYLLDKPIILKDKTGLHITGTISKNGEHATILKWTEFCVGFFLFSDLNNLRIENLKIIGPDIGRDAGNPRGKFEAVSCTESIDNISDISIHNLYIENVALGIYMGPATRYRYNSFSNLRITDNVIKTTFGTAPTGWGYGIRCAFIDSAIIENNFISDATRHSIYVASGLAGDSYIVKNNFILNHAKSSWTNPNISPYNISALTVARSNHVLIENNVIMNCYSNVALSIEYDDYYDQPIDDVLLVNNRIIGARNIGLWVNTGASHTAFGNEVILHPTSPGKTIALEDDSRLVEPPQRMVETNINGTGDGLFSLDNKMLSRINMSTKVLESSIKTELTGVSAMTSFTDSDRNQKKLYYVKNDTLYNVNTDDWSTKKSEVNWSGTQFMTATRDNIYIIQNNILHRVSPQDLSYFYRDTDWSGTQAICGWGDSVYIMRSGEFYVIDPDSLTAGRID